MTILVTGGTGIVGSRFLKHLVAAGFECRGLVRPGKALPAGVVPVEGNILDAGSLANAVDGVSAVVHLAAVFRTTDESLIWNSNLEGTRNLIAAAKSHCPCLRFIMASTTNIYDAGSPRPGREDDACDPKQAYPASKLAAERALQASGLNWSIQRLGFVYGDQDGHIEALPRYAVGGNWHPAKKMSMIHHRDVAHALALGLAGAMDGRIVNIVDDAPMSMYELVKLVGGEMPVSAEPLENPWHLHVDGSLARHLGFVPTIATTLQAAREGAL